MDFSKKFLLSLALCLLLVSTALSATPATTQSISQAYEQLANIDPAVRQSARQTLMRLTVDQLPALRAAVEQHRPTAAQVPVLREAVTGAMLASKPYQSDQRRGFLGISLGVIAQEDGVQRVVVESRLAGFVGYQRLQVGDIFVAVQDKQRTPIDSVTALQQAILGRAAGTPLTLIVIRGGRLVEVPVTLDAVPESAGPEDLGNLAPDPAQFQAMQASRIQAAQKYWDDHFAPLCKPYP